MTETANMNMNHNINNVEALWPRINRTYRFDTSERKSVPCNPLDDGSSYTLQFRVGRTQAKTLFQAMTVAYNDKRTSDWPEKLAMPFKKEDDGSYTHKAKLKGSYGEETTRPPAQYDAKGKKLPEDFLLTTGSTINIAVVLAPYSGAMGAGVSLRLKAVQVINLKPMVEAESPFDVVDGFDFDAGEPDNPFAEVDTPVKEPKKKAAKVAPPAPAKGSDDLGSIVAGWDD